MKNKARMLLTLFFTFLKIGAFTFGGGYAMVALLEAEFVSKKAWLSQSEFLDIVAIAESTPGPVAINSATYIGYKNAGFLGSLLSTIAVSLPSFVVIYVISLFFDDFLSLKWVGYAFRGIQCCVVYLIFSAGIKMLKNMERNFKSILIFSLVFFLSILFSLLSFSFSSIFFILASGFIYCFISSFGNCEKKEAE